MPALITRQFRIHNAKQFVESFSEADPSRYYYYIGKNYSYANTVQLTGTVKTTRDSNTVVGVGTVFTTELSIGDVVSFTGQSNTVVVHSIPSAQTFIATSSAFDTITVGANSYIRKQFSETNPPTPTDTYQDTYYEIWRNMIALKRVQTSDVTHVIPRYNWANNTLYYKFDDLDAALDGKQFYVITEDNNVYKCIDNNRNANSTVKPSGTVTSLISTSDGYIWKYLYTVSAASTLKFLTNDWMPVQTLTADDGSAQWSVQQAASNGSIQSITVTANGSGYLSSNGTIQSVSNSTVFSVNTSSLVDDIYNGSAIFISSGLGSGQLRKIVNYVGATKTITVNSAFTVTPNTLSTYIISPLVTIRGDSGGTTTSRATAYVSNTYGGQIRDITIISQGRSYSTANVSITANVGFGGTAKAVISPINGHGSDPVDELYGDNVMMNIRVSGSESNSFPTNNDFRFIGIVKDPLLANGGIANVSAIDQTTRVFVNGVTGDFFADEVITGANTGATARLVYFANTNLARTEGNLKVINLKTNGTGGKFAVGETVTGSLSGVSGNVQSVTVPALKPYSGLIIYNENKSPVTRSPLQTEDVKIVIKF